MSIETKKKIKTVCTALFVIACIASYLYFEAQEAKQHSQGSYEQYQQEQLAEREAEREAAEIAELEDMSILCEDLHADIADYVGQDCMIKGSVADMYQAVEEPGSPIFIDLDYAYPDENRVTIVIWEEYQDDYILSQLDEIEIGDTIYVEGEISTYGDVPQIEVYEGWQINTI